VTPFQRLNNLRLSLESGDRAFNFGMWGIWANIAMIAVFTILNTWP
jgi:hypothetical protein